MVMQTESKNLMSNLMPKLGFKKQHVTSSPQTKRQAPSPPVQELSISVDKFDQQQTSLFSASSTSSTNDKKTFTSASSTSSRQKNKSTLASVSSPSSSGSSESVVISSSSSSSPKTRKFYNNLAFENNANDYFEEILIDESCDHREMAIDCPDTFVPEFKTKPCYPPPQPQPVVQNKLLTFINQSYSSLQFIDEESRSKLNVTDSPVSESGVSSAPKLLYEKQKDGLINSAFLIEEESTSSGSSSSSSSRERVPTPKPTETKLELVEIQQEQDQEQESKQVDLLVRSFDNHHQLNDLAELDNTLGLYNKFMSLCAKFDFRPASDNVTHLITDAMKLLDSFRSSGEQCEHDELTRLLHSLKHLAQAHDEAAVLYNERKLKQQDENKTLAIKFKEWSSLEQDDATETEIIEDESLISDEGKYLLTKAEHYSVDNLKLVNIEKTSAPLGATIRSKDGNIVISRIVMGGAAHQSGLLHEDDQILEINNLPVRGKTINDICHLLANLTGIISFLIIPNMSYEPLELDECPVEPLKLRDKTLHVRALFSYVPHEDVYLPCKELGLAFNKGDILHVINDDDAQWWQAYKQSDNQSDNQSDKQGDKESGTSLAGLIPSQQFQQKRNEKLECMVGDSFMDKKKRAFCYRKHSKNARRKFMASDEQLTYEEMVLYKSERKRPIILIGPHSIGRHELRKRLMQTYPSMFEVAVPHTTRPPRKEEINGKDYHFLPKHIFEVDIKQARFVEHGEFEKNLYGTSYESIRKVIQNDKICVLNLYPQALKALKCSDLIPYVVYIGPPSLARLRHLKSSMNESFKDADLLDIIDKGNQIEQMYAHYFDKTIRMCDMNETFEQLYETICQVQSEPTWVPLSWIEKN